MSDLNEFCWISFQDEQPRFGERVDLICVIDDCDNCPDTTERVMGHSIGVYWSLSTTIDTHWRRRS